MSINSKNVHYHSIGSNLSIIASRLCPKYFPSCAFLIKVYINPNLSDTETF